MLIRRTSMLLAGLLATSHLAFAEPDDKDKDKEVQFDFAPAMVEGAFMAPPAAMPAEMGVTPGGAQDVAFARQRIEAGEVPHPNTFTPEGLFSEHDLPAPEGRGCAQMLCVIGATAPTELIAQPEVRTLAQLAFATNVDGRTWHREPLNLVAVVDKSGSMSGTPLETVKASLHKVASQLQPGDQLAVVLYGDQVHLVLPPTSAAALDKVHAGIDAIQSAGSTNLEAGLKLGYSVAFESSKHFTGTTRVMLFTDERPNVGTTDAGSFMDLAREGSKHGIGLTTIGVGDQFGAELATKISSVRGGNLFFFPDIGTMEAKFTDDFDTMVSELAYDLELVVEPAKGQRIVGLYGIPGDAVERTERGGLRLGIETVFLSRNHGGIFLAFAPEEGALPEAGPVGTAHLTYETKGGKRFEDGTIFTPIKANLPIGLARGQLLVDEITVLKAATARHLENNDQEGAWRLVRALRTRFEQAGVPGLEGEQAMVSKLEETLGHLSGHQGEGPKAQVALDPVNGLPR